MPDLSQELPVSSKAPNQDVNEKDVFCTFNIKIEPKFELWVYQRPRTRRVHKAIFLVLLGLGLTLGLILILRLRFGLKYGLH